MGFLKSVLAAMLTFIAVVCFTLFIGMATIKTTILSRDSVKSWISSSGAYDNALDSFIATSVGENGTALITNDIFKQAIINIFPATYLKENLELVINSVYDWLDGRTNSIELNIPVNEKQGELISSLATLLEARLRTLPRCAVGSSVLDPNEACLPVGITAKKYAAEVANLSIKSSSLLANPITQQDFPLPGELPGPTIQLFTKNLTLIITVLLPVLALAAITLRLVLAAPGKKIDVLSGIFSQVAMGAMLSFTIGTAALIFGAQLKLAPTLGMVGEQQKVIVEKVIDPIIAQALPAIGGQLMLFSGVIMVISLLIWLGPRTLQRSKERYKKLHPAGLTNSQFPTYPGSGSKPTAQSPAPEPKKPPL